MNEGVLRFPAAAVEAFRRMSHDANPLHVDRVYARRTPFGEVVVHGMLGVLAALRPVLEGGPVRLRSLRCAFRAPLYRDTDYSVDAQRDGRAMKLRVLSGEAAKLELAVAFEPAPRAHEPPSGQPCVPYATPLSPSPAELSGCHLRGHYGIDTAAVASLEGGLALPLANLPSCQLQTLAWVSYACGMIAPGVQSLIGSVDAQFHDPDGPDVGILAFDLRVEQMDARFGVVRLRHALHAGGRPVADVSVTAFVRPPPVAFSVDELRGAVAASAAMRGRVALVTGGARGLGAYLAGALALQGADVIVNYRSEEAEAAALRDALREAGGSVEIARADVSDASACARLGRRLEEANGHLDVLVNNAFPAILPRTFAEQGEAGLAEFVAQSLPTSLVPTRVLLPLLRRARGTVLTVSSEYATKPPAGFAHYVAAKLATEGVMTTLAREEANVRFVVVRPPKLLTDQTNTNFDFTARLHPARAAARILQVLLGMPEDRRYVLVDRL